MHTNHQFSLPWLFPRPLFTPLLALSFAIAADPHFLFTFLPLTQPAFLLPFLLAFRPSLDSLPSLLWTPKHGIKTPVGITHLTQYLQNVEAEISPHYYCFIPLAG